MSIKRRIEQLETTGGDGPRGGKGLAVLLNESELDTTRPEVRRELWRDWHEGRGFFALLTEEDMAAWLGPEL